MAQIDEIHQQVAAYALDALDDGERRVFEEHLAACTICRSELDSLRDAAAALALNVEGPPPPAQLRARLLDQVRAERPPAEVIPLRRRIALPAAAALAAVAACAALGIGIWAASLSSSLSNERAARSSETRALALLATPGARRFPVAGASGAVVVTPQRDAALVVSGLPDAPKGKTYEVWVLAAGPPAPAGLFSGGDRSIVPLTRRVPTGGGVAVSIEPHGGSKIVTGPIIVRARTA